MQEIFLWLGGVVCNFYQTLPSPGDAESASMAAGLAVGKPDDGFSIADSALGTRSVVSVTTAGVTQFSEVSQISNCY